MRVKVLHLRAGEGEDSGEARNQASHSSHTLWSTHLAQHQEVPGRDRTVVREEIDDDVAHAGLDEHRHLVALRGGGSAANTNSAVEPTLVDQLINLRPDFH
eukprot:scaffold183_cov249-Pinguiococcus_pyrenoidosus.AAC.23